ncbi:7844_t:CDS:2 [Entrophospora sp. SA101]|nr:7844_t:CDS:2 [Entrophospora sp. SA101]
MTIKEVENDFKPKQLNLLGHETTYKQERAQCEDENEDNELSEVEGNLNNEIREGDEESDNGSNESDTIIELYELDGYEND